MLRAHSQDPPPKPAPPASPCTCRSQRCPAPWRPTSRCGSPRHVVPATFRLCGCGFTSKTWSARSELLVSSAQQLLHESVNELGLASSDCARTLRCQTLLFCVLQEALEEAGRADDAQAAAAKLTVALAQVQPDQQHTRMSELRRERHSSATLARHGGRSSIGSRHACAVYCPCQALGAVPAGGSPAARLLQGVGARAQKRVAEATVSARLAATRVGEVQAAAGRAWVKRVLPERNICTGQTSIAFPLPCCSSGRSCGRQTAARRAESCRLHACAILNQNELLGAPPCSPWCAGPEAGGGGGDRRAAGGQDAAPQRDAHQAAGPGARSVAATA